MVEPKEPGHDRLPWIEEDKPKNVQAAQGRSPTTARWLVGLLIGAMVATASLVGGRRSVLPPQMRSGSVRPAPGAAALTGPTSQASVLTVSRSLKPSVRSEPSLRDQADRTTAFSSISARHHRLARPGSPQRRIYRAFPRHYRARKAISRHYHHRPRRHILAYRLVKKRGFASVRLFRQRLRDRHSEVVRTVPRVQLGAVWDARQALWAEQFFRYRYRGLLANLPQQIVRTRLGRSQRFYYRIQFLPPSKLYADITCRRIRATGQWCVVV